MGLEVGSFVNDLVATNPLATDAVGLGDDHLRLIKSCVLATFPQMGANFGKATQQDATVVITALQNTQSLAITASATTTTLLTLPASASITSGWYIDLNTLATGQVTVTPASGSINGAANFSMPAGTYSRVTYMGASVWRASRIPNGQAAATLATDLSVSGTLTVSGIATFKSGVTVSGVTILNSAVTMNSTLTVSGAATLNTTLSVSGAVTLGSTLSVSGAFHANTTASIGGAMTLASTLSVSGAAVFGGLVTMGGGLHVDGAVTLSAAVTLNSTLSVSGAFHANTTASIGGAVTMASTLSVSGAATFLGAVSISGAAILSTTLQVRGAVTADTTLSVSGAASFNGTMSVSGAFHAKTTLSVGGAASLASTLSVSGATHLNTTLSVGGATLLGTTLTVSGAVTLQSTLSVSGAFHAKTSLSVGGASLLGGGVIVNGRTSLSGSVVVTGLIQTTNGQIQFPATANPSANANTLDDYEEGTWTPVLTYTTPGTLVVAYGTQSGSYTKIGRKVHALFGIVTTTHTLGTATGNLIVSNLPFAPNVGPGQTPGKCAWQGITKASYTEVDWTVLNAATDTQFIASGSAQTRSNIQVGNTASGTQVTLYGNVTYHI